MRSCLTAAVLILAATLACAADGPFPLSLRVFPTGASITIDGAAQPAPSAAQRGTGPHTLSLSRGAHTLSLSAAGYLPKELTVSIPETSVLEAKLERRRSAFSLVGFIDTGSQPKSAELTPDGRFIVIPNLQDRGTDVFSVDTLTRAAVLAPPDPYPARTGFVESAFIQSRGEVWISQMTTGMLHVFGLADWAYLGSVSSGGSWTKVIAVSPDQKTVYASNWLSNDVAVIDAAARKRIALIPVGGVPRGMVLSRDGKFLYVCMYEQGKVLKIDAASRALVKTLTFGGAMRHIVLHPTRDVFYISDMARRRILVVDAVTDRLTAQIPVGDNPNTIALSPDGSYLFVSCRGVNGPDYTKKGPEFGKVYCINTRDLRRVDWVWGMNQPTGLCVSPDGRTVVFTDFLDRRAEVYRFIPEQLP